MNGVPCLLARSRAACRLHQVYYIFGVLFVVFGILVVTCAEITIVLCACPRNGYRGLPARLPARAILRATLTSC